MKNIVKVVTFLLLMASLLYGLNQLLVQKSPEFLMMDEFLSLDNNSVDLLCVGSSHAYTSCNTEVYWNEYGIPAFCISGPSQTVANSYYYIKEALKTQSPKVILLEASCIMFPYSNYEYGNVNNIIWMPHSLNRVNALAETVAEPYQDNLKWNLYYFHNRWKELDRKDYAFVAKNYRPSTKGFNPWWNYKDYTDSITQWGTEYELEPDAKSVEYIDKIISVCEDQNIRLVVYLSAHNVAEYDYGTINWYRRYFDQNNIDFIDGIQLSDMLGIEPEIDNSNGHIAYGGSIKLSRYIGNYLSEREYVTDRRGNNAYFAWEEWSHYFEDMEVLYNMTNIEDLALYLEKLTMLKNAFTILVYHGALEEGQINSAAMEGIQSNDLHIDFTNNDMYIAVMIDGSVVWETQCGIIDEKYIAGEHIISINSEADKGLFNIMVDYHRIMTLNQIPVENNMQVCIYDSIADEVRENRSFYLRTQ